jgi:uncharacterized delta-60 repeat protein
MVVVRYLQDGTPDNSFGILGNGRVFIDFNVNQREEARDVAIQDDGKIVVVGSADVGGNENFAVARLNPNGTLDTSFSGDGLYTHDFNAGGGADRDTGNAAADYYREPDQDDHERDCGRQRVGHPALHHAPEHVNPRHLPRVLVRFLQG